jgi:hypothetical protein
MLVTGGVSGGLVTPNAWGGRHMEGRESELTCNRTLVAYQIRPVVRRKMLVQHTVQPSCLVLVPIHTIFDMLRSISSKVVYGCTR